MPIYINDNFPWEIEAESLEEAVELLIVEHCDSVNSVNVEELYEEYIDELYWEHEIPWVWTYNTSYLLQELDPTAYRVWMSDYESEMFEEIQGELYRKDDCEEIENYTYEK